MARRKISETFVLPIALGRRHTGRRKLGKAGETAAARSGSSAREGGGGALWACGLA